MRLSDCDWGEERDHTRYSGPVPARPQPQTGDQRCHRRCDADRRCAPGERCELRTLLVSDSGTRGVHLCMCATDACVERGPGGTPRPPEGGLALWRSQPELPLDLYDHAAAAAGGWLFTGGGLHLTSIGVSTTTEPVRDVFVSRIRRERVEGWMRAGAMPRPLASHAFAVARGRLYVAGGQVRERTSDVLTAAVISASIGAEGKLGPWRTEAALPAPRVWHRLVVAGDLLIAAGGMIDRWGTTKLLWRARLGAGGAIAAWEQVVAPGSVYDDAAAAFAGGRLYLFGKNGGLHSAALPALRDSRVEAAPPFYPPFLWRPGPAGPVHLHGTSGALVALLEGGNALTASLDADGRVGAWRIASRFHGAAAGYASASADDAIFALGGFARTPLIVGSASVFSAVRQ